MWVPMELRTIAVCKAALENDPDAIGWVPDDKQWLGAAVEGHLLTVHCDCVSWRVEVTDINGNSLVDVKTDPQTTLSDLLAQLQVKLDDM